MIAVEEVITKLQGLSLERAEKVVSLIDDLAALEALEEKVDVEDARAVLANPGECVTLNELEQRLGL